MCAGTIHLYLFKDRERDVLTVSKCADLRGRSRLLTTKLVARKGEDDKTFGRQL